MNELNSALSIVPAKYQPIIALGIVYFPYITRGAFALYNGKGIVGAVKGILFGTNTPTAPAQSANDAQARHDATLTQITTDKK